jgi:iron complex transport system substrate-binding protein
LTHLGWAAQVVTLEPATLDAVLDSIADVGVALGAEAEATDLVRPLRGRLENLGRRCERAPVSSAGAGADRPALLGRPLVPDLVTAGGRRPVMGDPGADSHPLNWDAISTATAEVVIVAPCGYHLERAYKQPAELVAGRRLPADAQVWAVDADSYFVRPGPRLVDGAELVGQIVHPTSATPPTRHGHVALCLAKVKLGPRSRQTQHPYPAATTIPEAQPELTPLARLRASPRLPQTVGSSSA